MAKKKKKDEEEEKTEKDKTTLPSGSIVKERDGEQIILTPEEAENLRDLQRRRTETLAPISEKVRQEYLRYEAPQALQREQQQQAQEKFKPEMEAREKFSEEKINPLRQELERMSLEQPELKKDINFGKIFENIGKTDFSKASQGLSGMMTDKVYSALGLSKEQQDSIRGAKSVAQIGELLVAAGVLTSSAVIGLGKLSLAKLSGAGTLAMGYLIGGASPGELGQDRINKASEYVSEVDSAQDQLRGNLDAGMSPQDIVLAVQQQQEEILRWESIVQQRSQVNFNFRISREYLILQQEIATARANMAETLRAVDNTLLTGEKDIDPQGIFYFSEKLNKSSERIRRLADE